MPELSYFAIFGLSPKFLVDGSQLQQKFYELSRKYHPDRVLHLDTSEQQKSGQQITAINEAYAVLKDFESTVEYILKEYQIPESKELPLELSEEYFEVQEWLRDAVAYQSQIKAWQEKLQQLLDQNAAQLKLEAQNWDKNPTPEILFHVRKVWDQRRYMLSMLKNLQRSLG